MSQNSIEADVKVHITPQFFPFFAYSNLLVIRSILAQNFLNLLESSILYALSKLRLKCCTTEFRESGAPQSALCIWSRNWKAKLVVPIYFGTKTSEFWLKIISCSSLESAFRFERLRKNFERVRQLWNHCLELWEHFAIFPRIFQATMGKTSLRTNCSYIRNGKLDTKWRSRSRRTKSRKE